MIRILSSGIRSLFSSQNDEIKPDILVIPTFLKATTAMIRTILAIIVAVIVFHGAYLELNGRGYAGVMPESTLRFR